jgi:hypothetical protein
MDLFDDVDFNQEFEFDNYQTPIVYDSQEELDVDLDSALEIDHDGEQVSGNSQAPKKKYRPTPTKEEVIA